VTYAVFLDFIPAQSTKSTPRQRPEWGLRPDRGVVTTQVF